MTNQKLLSRKQISLFLHSFFVETQIRHFEIISASSHHPQKVLFDIGGGCGYFATAVRRDFDIQVRVMDQDEDSIKIAQKAGVEAFVGDLFTFTSKGDEGTVCFNLILHHLVSSSEKETRSMQIRALSRWSESNVQIFVNEYIYESYLLDLTGWLIYAITSNKMLSLLLSIISKVVPSLRANTFGTGVRFRSNSGWRAIFEEAGFSIQGEIRGMPEKVSLARRLLLISQIRLDSFLLTPCK